MNGTIMKFPGWLLALTAMMALLFSVSAHAAIDGISGTTFNLTAGTSHINTADGNSIFIWGFADGAKRTQYPGPTLIVNQGATITVNLTNTLDEPVSIVFPGQAVTATGGIPGLVTREADKKVGNVSGTVSYTFVASQPGTYLYHSGTHQDLQVEMGLFGALIVRPTGFNPMAPTAYGHPGSAYEQEFLFLLSEMDPDIHRRVELGRKAEVDTSAAHMVTWFINGRGGPDTMAPAGAAAPHLPSQPYNCMPVTTPGDRLLLRLIGANKDLHPFHTHGNNFRLIAKDGKMLESDPGVSGPDLAVSNFTQRVVPGETYDALFTWTGQGLNWDAYGPPAGDPIKGIPAHTCVDTNPLDGFDDVTREYCPDHGKAFPVALPSPLELTNGPQFSGSPFLGVLGSLPPGQGTGNLDGGYFYMWHSHNERELTNNDIFPGGLFTMLMVVPRAAMMAP